MFESWGNQFEIAAIAIPANAAYTEVISKYKLLLSLIEIHIENRPGLSSLPTEAQLCVRALVSQACNVAENSLLCGAFIRSRRRFL